MCIWDTHVTGFIDSHCKNYTYESQESIFLTFLVIMRILCWWSHAFYITQNCQIRRSFLIKRHNSVMQIVLEMSKLHVYTNWWQCVTSKSQLLVYIKQVCICIDVNAAGGIAKKIQAKALLLNLATKIKLDCESHINTSMDYAKMLANIHAQEGSGFTMRISGIIPGFL